MPAVTRIGDADVPHCSAMVRAQGSGNVFVNNIPVSRQDDLNTGHKLPGSPCPTHAAPITTGSITVFINGKGCGRVGDAITDCTSVAEGSPNVFVGDIPFSPVITLSGTGPALEFETTDEQDQALESELNQDPPDVGDTEGQVERFYLPTPRSGGADALGTKSGLVQPANANTSDYPGSTPPPTNTNPEDPGPIDPSVAASTATADQIPEFLSQLLVEAGNQQWDETENPSNSNIIGIWEELGFPDTAYWKTDQTPWCAGFVNWVLKRTGYKFMQSARAYDFRDKTRLYGGVKVPIYDGQPGDIVVWDYSHVNFIYTVSSPGSYRFVGGNQSDRATGDNNPSGGTITNSGGRTSRIVGIYRPVRA